MKYYTYPAVHKRQFSSAVGAEIVHVLEPSARYHRRGSRMLRTTTILAALAALGPWLGSTLLRFTRMCFEQFPNVLF